MSRLILAHGSAAVLLACAVAAADVPPEKKAAAERIGVLVGQLGARGYAEREQATRALDAFGPEALDALRKASVGGDAETRRRARALVRKIEVRLTTERALAPQRVRLTYRGAPLLQAIDDFAKKTGAVIRVEGDRAALAGRTVTLDTGETSFWEAFTRFCRLTGLREVEGALASDRPAPRQGGMSVTIGGGGPRMASTDVTKPAPDRPLVLTVAAGEPPLLPTHLAGGVRVRALPFATPGDLTVMLDVTADPSLRWEEVLGVRVLRAVDDQGQELKGRFAPLAPPAPAVAIGGGGVVVINGVVIRGNMGDRPRAESRRLPLRFEAAARPSKSLKELSGTITAEVQSAVEALVTVDGIREAAGKKFDGPQGSSVRVVDVKGADGGDVVVRVEVAVAPRGISDGTDDTPPLAGMNIIINGRRLGEPEQSLTGANFGLFDAKGRPFAVVRALKTHRVVGTAMEYELTYRPGAGVGTAARFVYRDRRSALVEVPFTLKGVPLP